MNRTSQERPRRWRIALLNLGFLMAAASLHGAVITWGTAVNIAGDRDVLNAGTPLYAYSWSGITSTVNGVTFIGSPGINGGTNVLAPAFTNYGPAYFTSKATPFSMLSTAYSNILIGADYIVGRPAPVALENLTSGHNYSVQVWVNDPRGPENARSETITSAGGNTNLLRFSVNFTNTNPGGPGQYLIGNFTADATSQTFTLNGGTNGVSQLNALQLRDVTPAPIPWSSTTVKAGQTWTLGFKSLISLNPAVSSPSPSPNTVKFFYATGGPTTASLECFENTLSDSPLTFSLAWTNPPPIIGVTAPNFWSDHQGWVRLHVITGEVTFSFMNIDVYNWPVGLYESTFYQPPSLSEVVSTNSSGVLQLTLQWPLLYNMFPIYSPDPVQFTLQSSLSGASGSWSDVPNVVGNSVTVDLTGPQRFYRLINSSFSMTLR
ncbi:MAG TPA: hypothetical protein VKY92_20270 [Verrucomicrobiae bacterium]|nr:hypothetical protein [Verrucomicrobiae bacterium]